MPSSRTFLWCFILLAGVFTVFGQNKNADDSPALPDHYAKVVLQVEGMI
ncbi:MAG: hypothetical protein H8E37_12785 [Planctomycetes bacterium]|nr:hypothetical protein [Planctomycetota bacterium]